MSTIRQRDNTRHVPNGLRPDSNIKKEDITKTTAMAETVPRRSDNKHIAMLLACFTGIFVSYFIYGLLQERITKSDFGGEKFRFFMFLVCFQCIINALVAIAAALYRREAISLKPFTQFGLLSFSYVGAMVTSNKALAYISYPTQVLGKSAKPIPVMIFGVLVNKKTYRLVKYLCILMIVFGVGLFLYKDTPNKKTAADSDPESWTSYKLFDTIGIGEILVFLSLTLDGLTGCMQERLKSSHKITAFQLMFAVNCYAPIYLLIGLAVTGEGLNAVQFVVHHPEVILNLLAFSVASAVGQIFIFTTITEFGPLVCAVITTTRKFFTILVSVLVFGNALLTRQWIAVVLVFVGLGLDAYYGKKSMNKVQSQTQVA